jgi:hypothetical protein
MQLHLRVGCHAPDKEWSVRSGDVAPKKPMKAEMELEPRSRSGIGRGRAAPTPAPLPGSAPSLPRQGTRIDRQGVATPIYRAIGPRETPLTFLVGSDAFPTPTQPTLEAPIVRFSQALPGLSNRGPIDRLAAFIYYRLCTARG